VKNERDKTIDQTETRRRQTLANIFQRKTNERTQDTKKENTVRHSLELVFKLGMLAMGGKGVRYFQSGRLNMDELDACLEIRG
jgi:zona occludens toxin (predicted ATPase)